LPEKLKAKDIIPSMEPRDKKEALGILKTGLHALLHDSQLTDQEIADFWKVHERLKLSPEDSHPLRAEAFVSRVDQATKGRIPTPEELNTLNNLFFGLRLSPTDPQVLNALKTLQRCLLIRLIEGGELPQLPPETCQLNLQEEELAHVKFNASLLEERTIRSGYRGGYSGFSFRIAKGVRWHIGGSAGGFTSEKAYTPVSEGFLYLTNQRIAFLGRPKSLAFPWKKVLGVNPYQDGILVYVNRAKCPFFQFPEPLTSEVCALICDHYLNADNETR
jgi:hypothetical protein